MLLDHLAGAGQAEAGALDLPGNVAGSEKPLEDPRQIPAPNADSLILNGEDGPIPVRGLLPRNA